MAAYKESAAAAEERERRKREEKALKRWAKLINGLRVRERLRDTYGEKGNVSSFCVLSKVPQAHPGKGVSGLSDHAKPAQIRDS